MDNVTRDQLIYNLYKTKKHTQKSLSRLFGLVQGRISGIIKEQKSGGYRKLDRGAVSKLTTTQRSLLAFYLSKSPLDFGFTVWNKRSIRSLISSKFHVEYHENYIGQLVKKMGFTSQKPQKVDYRKPSDKRSDFIENKALCLKKSNFRKSSSDVSR